jgi:hypothetical protein
MTTTTTDDRPATQVPQNDPLLQGVLQAVSGHLKTQFDEYHSEHLTLCRTLEQIATVVRQSLEKAGQANEHAQYQLSDALLKLQEQGVGLRHDPYTVQVQACTPLGYHVTLTMANSDKGELMQELIALISWLAQQGYVAAQPD